MYNELRSSLFIQTSSTEQPVGGGRGDPVDAAETSRRYAVAILFPREREGVHPPAGRRQARAFSSTRAKLSRGAHGDGARAAPPHTHLHGTEPPA